MSTAAVSSDTISTHSIAVIGGGSAAEALTRELEGTGHDIVVFEPEYVGGECPFLACMPSKSMLHDRTTGRTWAEAVRRRDEVVDHLDDTDHAEQLDTLGVTLVRSRARIIGPGVVESGGVKYEVEHIVIATGAAPLFPEIDGLDADHSRVWTSRDALTVAEQPKSIVVIGGGVIGSELAFMFAGFGTAATTLDMSERPADDLHPTTSAMIRSVLTDAGVDVVSGIQIERVELTDDDATVHLAGGSSHTAERLLVAVGRKPVLDNLGLESLGIDPEHVDVDTTGRLQGVDGGPVWLAGDVAGMEQYTHIANHHAAVLADQIAGSGERRYDDVVVPACIFLDPPAIVVGPTSADLDGDDDIIWAEVELATPRNTTDEHGEGFLAVAARRSTGCLVAANGIGAEFDEIIHALVVAIDGEVPVARLTQTIQPFPTVGEILTQAFDSLADQLTK